LNSQDIFNQQTQVINKINKQLEPSVFSTFLPNYKDLATISQLFDDNVSIKQRVLLEQQVEKILCSNEVVEENKMRPIDNLVYKQVIKKFNEKYSTGLLEEQKTLFSKYILSYADNNADLVVYLNEEISRIRNSINVSTNLNQADKNQLNSKIDELKSKPIDKEIIESVLNFQSLIKELEN